MRTLLEIYFAINLFLAGYQLQHDLNWAKERADKIISWVTCISAIFLGLPWAIALVSYYGIIEKILKPIDGCFQIRFWFTWFFTEKWDKIEENILALNNRIALNKHNTNSISDRIYRHCNELINRKNNYIYKPEEKDEL